ncbi:MAG: polymerase sigma-70 factor, subfamily [Chloroflexota bacterium]|jgi:RNA polymerase sigma-70 factor (ECF subfamily)|nr:polymerase sigma-70 factor, subfamily [Chloroflexota bacterium]
MAEPNPAVVRSAQQGDESALVELITSQQRYVYSIALGVVGNPADAADVTQDTVIRLLRVLPTYRAETKFTTWLYRLVTNIAIDHLRRRHGTHVSLDEPIGDDGPQRELEDEDPNVDPPLQLDRAETTARVQAALQQLPPRQRAALTMCYFEDMRYEEIAAALGLPLNTVKSHIRRAKVKMAELLRTPEPAEDDHP